MCGIVGYIGDRECADVLVDGLRNWNIEDMIRQELRYFKMARLSLKNQREN